jgi:hypothetical protein
MVEKFETLFMKADIKYFAVSLIFYTVKMDCVENFKTSNQIKCGYRNVVLMNCEK